MTKQDMDRWGGRRHLPAHSSSSHADTGRFPRIWPLRNGSGLERALEEIVWIHRLEVEMRWTHRRRVCDGRELARTWIQSFGVRGFNRHSLASLDPCPPLYRFGKFSRPVVRPGDMRGFVSCGREMALSSDCWMERRDLRANVDGFRHPARYRSLLAWNLSWSF